MTKISLKMKPITGGKRWQPENGRAVIKPITTAPLSWLAQGRLGAKVKNKYMDKTQATKPPSTKAKAATFFWRASARAQNAFTSHHTARALGLQKNDASQPLPIFRGMDFHGALRKKTKKRLGFITESIPGRGTYKIHHYHHIHQSSINTPIFPIW
jgi:hypothetical protein